MNFDPLCWIWREELPETICDEIVKLCEQRELETATVEGGDVRPSVRVTEVSFVDPDINRLWLEAVCRTYIEAGNVWGIRLNQLRALNTLFMKKTVSMDITLILTTFQKEEHNENFRCPYSCLILGSMKGENFSFPNL